MADQTVDTLILDAYRDAAVLGVGKNLTAAQTVDAIAKLNRLLALWSEDGLIVPSASQVSHALTQGTASYSIGSGQTIDTARPIDIRSAFVRDASNYDTPVEILQADEDYDRIPVKTTQGRPYQLRYVDSYPYGTVKLFYTPGSGYTLYMDVEQPLTAVATGDTVTLPGSFQEYIVASLASWVCGRYGRQTPPEVVAALRVSEKAVKRRNVQVPKAQFDPALNQRRRYGSTDNIYGG